MSGDSHRGDGADASSSAGAYRTPADRLDPDQIARPRGADGPDLSDSRILVVDDEPLNLQLLDRILRRAGFRAVRSTDRSSEAVAIYADMKPDLVLLDLNMPELDGFQVMDQLARVTDPREYVPILVLTGDASPATKRAALSAGAKDFVNKPFEPEEVLLRIRNLLETRWLYERQRRHARELEATVQERTAELKRAQEEALELLALASEYRDDDTGRHTRRVGVVAALLAAELGLPQDEVNLIRRAAPLHDVGKIGIPDMILLKPGPIDGDEREVIRRHTLIGSRILSRASFRLMRLAAEIAACHHEWWDGTGYPAGLQGDQIPLSSRIVALADVFDSLTHARPYKRAWTLNEAVKEIGEYRGVQFDPAVVDAFLRLHGRGEVDPAALDAAADAAVYGLGSDVELSRFEGAAGSSASEEDG